MASVDHWARIDVTAPDDPGGATRRGQALGLLIYAARVMGEAKELGMSVSNRKVRELLEQAQADARANFSGGPVPKEAELQRQLRVRGETSRDRLWLTKVHVLAARVQDAQIAEAERKITRTQLIGYYRRSRGRFVLPERRNIEAIIAWRKATVMKAERDLKAGVSFSRVAERYNEQPSEGGLRIGLARGSQLKRYEKDFFAARPHVLIGPLKEVMYYIFEVTKITPSRQQSLSEVEGIVRTQLVEGELRKLLVQVQKSVLRRWRARTRCITSYMVQSCGSSLG